jgi:hypothetical protein
MSRNTGFSVVRVFASWLALMALTLLLAGWLKNDFISIVLSIPTWGGPYLLMYMMSENQHRPEFAWFFVGLTLHLSLWLMLGCYWRLVVSWIKNRTK